MNEWTGMLCLGSILLAPLVAFAIGFLAGRNKLPYTVKIERNRASDYVIDAETPQKN